MQFGFLAPVKNIILNARESALFKSFDMMSKLLWLNLLVQEKLPACRFASSLAGDAIGNTGDYSEIFVNKSDRPVAAKVGAFFTGAQGQQAKLSFSSDKGTYEILDYLSSSASAPAWGVKRVSDVIIVNPGQRLFIANARDVTFPLLATDRFVVNVFDVSDYLVDSAWEAR